MSTIGPEIETNYEKLRMDRDWSHDTLADHLDRHDAKQLAAHFRAKGAALAAQDVDAPQPADEQPADTTPPKNRRAPKTETA